MKNLYKPFILGLGIVVSILASVNIAQTPNPTVKPAFLSVQSDPVRDAAIQKRSALFKVELEEIKRRYENNAQEVEAWSKRNNRPIVYTDSNGRTTRVMKIVNGVPHIYATQSIQDREIRQKSVVFSSTLLIIRFKDGVLNTFLEIKPSANNIAATGVSSIDALNEKWNVTKMAPLYPLQEAAPTGAIQALWTWYTLEIESPSNLEEAMKDYQNNPLVDVSITSQLLFGEPSTNRKIEQ
jgi:hypothetical protein